MFIFERSPLAPLAGLGLILLGTLIFTHCSQRVHPSKVQSALLAPEQSDSVPNVSADAAK